MPVYIYSAILERFSELIHLFIRLNNYSLVWYFTFCAAYEGFDLK